MWEIAILNHQVFVREGLGPSVLVCALHTAVGRDRKWSGELLTVPAALCVSVCSWGA